MRKFTLLAVLVISLLAQFPVAEARNRHHGHGGAAVAGLIGLGLGLALATPRVYYEPETVIVEREYRRVPRRYYRKRHWDDYDDDRYYRRDRYRYYDD